MPNQVSLKELNAIANQLGKPIYDASHTKRRRAKGHWFRTEEYNELVWRTKPNLDNTAAYYTLVDVNDEEKEIDSYPAKIKYVHWTHVLIFQFELRDTIEDIKRRLSS